MTLPYQLNGSPSSLPIHLLESLELETSGYTSHTPHLANPYRTKQDKERQGRAS